MNGVLKCKWCDYHTALWINRKPRGHQRLRDHVYQAHEKEYDAIQRWLPDLDDIAADAERDNAC